MSPSSTPASGKGVDGGKTGKKKELEKKKDGEYIASGMRNEGGPKDGKKRSFRNGGTSGEWRASGGAPGFKLKGGIGKGRREQTMKGLAKEGREGKTGEGKGGDVKKKSKKREAADKETEVGCIRLCACVCIREDRNDGGWGKGEDRCSYFYLSSTE